MTYPLIAPRVSDTRTEVDAWMAGGKRRQWKRDPVLWARDRLGRELWSAQKKVMEAVRDNRHVAVRSSFATGKSFVAATIAAWWIDVHPPGKALVVTTATTEAQIKGILWSEIAIAHAAGKLGGRLNQTEWWMHDANGVEKMVGIGRKPADTNAVAFQGYHRKYVLVIIDEGSGVASAIYDAAEGLTPNEHCRILVIGNPEDPLSMFAEISNDPDWVAFKISAFDTPAFTGEPVSQEVLDLLVSKIWVEERKRRWGEDNPKYIAKVLGEFPEISENCLILPRWVTEAQNRDISTLPPARVSELGVDVGAGGDRTVIAHRVGAHVRILKSVQEPDTMKAARLVEDALRTTGASLAKIDEIGVGKGVVDRLKEKRLNVVGVNVGKAPDRIVKRKGKREIDEHDDAEQFLNRRAQGYWHLRELFVTGQIVLDTSGPRSEDMAAQLQDIRYERLSNGVIKIESKEEMKRRKRLAGSDDADSPDEADAVMLAFMDAATLKTVSATWGSRKRRR